MHERAHSDPRIPHGTALIEEHGDVVPLVGIRPVDIHVRLVEALLLRQPVHRRTNGSVVFTDAFECEVAVHALANGLHDVVEPLDEGDGPVVKVPNEIGNVFEGVGDPLEPHAFARELSPIGRASERKSKIRRDQVLGLDDRERYFKAAAKYSSLNSGCNKLVASDGLGNRGLALCVDVRDNVIRGVAERRAG